MRTAIIILAGFVFLGICLFAGRFFGRGPETIALGAKIFIPLWLLAAAINLWMGVAKAGYTVMEELPIFALIFALPAVAAAYVWWKFS
jgi:hypothetical protein